jgi:hypothetical protein
MQRNEKLAGLRGERKRLAQEHELDRQIVIGALRLLP